MLKPTRGAGGDSLGDEQDSNGRDQMELKTRAKPRNWAGRLIAGVAAVALLGGIAETATGQDSPASQVGKASALTGNALKQLCVSEGLILPKISDAVLANPGRKNNYKTQIFSLDAEYDAMPGRCGGKYRRISQAKFQLQNPLKNNRWIHLERPHWQTMNPGNGGGLSGANFSGNNHQPDRIYYKCTPGKRKTEARAVVRNLVQDLRTKRFVAAKYLRVPLKIQGGGC